MTRLEGGWCTEKPFVLPTPSGTEKVSKFYLDHRQGKVLPSKQTGKDFLSQMDGSGFYLENTSL